jgi:hypothetical protein
MKRLEDKPLHLDRKATVERVARTGIPHAGPANTTAEMGSS